MSFVRFFSITDGNKVKNLSKKTLLISGGTVFVWSFEKNLHLLSMKLKIFTLFFLVTALMLGSCSKESNEEPGYEYTYKLTGPGTTKVQVQYTPTMTDPNMTEVPDDLEYEELVTPPWQKSVRLHKNISGAGFSANVSEGIPGSTYTISILGKEDKILETTSFTLDEYGDGIALLNYYRSQP